MIRFEGKRGNNAASGRNCRIQNPALRSSRPRHRTDHGQDAVPDGVRQVAPGPCDFSQVGFELGSRCAPVVLSLCFCCVFLPSGRCPGRDTFCPVLDTVAVRIPGYMADLYPTLSGSGR